MFDSFQWRRRREQALQIGWRDGDGGLHHDTLFGVFAALARGEAWSFTALRPHQREPWHAFTVQVAALALIHAGLDELPGDEAAWHDLLIALTPDHPDGEAWSLVVDDWTKPALLQPPVGAGNRADYKSRLRTPDALDILVTAKNHDIKNERIKAANEDDWLFSLVTLQTSSAYGGARTYGASRMNGKTGSRLIVRIRPSGGTSASFRRDVRLLSRAARSEKEQRALLWLEPNTGQLSLPHHTLAPSLYVDCARRIRLVSQEDQVTGYYATAEKARVNADAYAGVTGDPYAPIKSGRDASITPKRETFGYRGITRVLKSDLPLLGRLYDSDGTTGLAINLSALVRKGGTDTNTAGLFERLVHTTRIEPGDSFGEFNVLDRAGEIAELRTGEAGEAGNKLKFALLTLLQGAPTEPGPDKRLAVRLNDRTSGERAGAWKEEFDRRIDLIFFDDDFWAHAADKANDRHYRVAWRKRLYVMAGIILAEAAEAAPRSEIRRIRAIARSRSIFDAQMTNWLKEIAA